MWYLEQQLDNVESRAKQKYRRMFETQKSGRKTSSGEIGQHLQELEILQNCQYFCTVFCSVLNSSESGYGYVSSCGAQISGHIDIEVRL